MKSILSSTSLVSINDIKHYDVNCTQIPTMILIQIFFFFFWGHLRTLYGIYTVIRRNEIVLFLSYRLYHQHRIIMSSSLPKALLSLLLCSHYALITILQKPISLRMLLFQPVLMRFYIAFA